MSALIAVITCQGRLPYADAQRASWVQAVGARADVRFFLARQDREPLADEVFLDVDDGYNALPEKVRAACRWAVGEKYQRMLKTDDDVVIWPNRMAGPTGHYSGWKQEPESDNWCSGLGYWLGSSVAIQAVANAELTEQAAEDRWAGKALLKEGLRAQRMTGIQWLGKRNRLNRVPLPNNWLAICTNAWIAGEFLPDEIEQAYRKAA